MEEITQYRRDLRGKIIAYAMEEFFKRGVKAVKMDEISQGLHVSKRTVYEIFGDKEEMLLAGMKRLHERNRIKLADFARREAKNVIDIISYVYQLQMVYNEKIGVEFFEEIHKMPRVVDFLEACHNDQREDSARFFEKGIQEGFFRPDVDFEVLTNVGHMVTQEIMHHQFYRQYSLQTLYDNYFLVIIRGFCTDRGIQLLDKALKGLMVS